jgi:hypothetical protein
MSAVELDDQGGERAWTITSGGYCTFCDVFNLALVAKGLSKAPLARARRVRVHGCGEDVSRAEHASSGLVGDQEWLG